MDGAVKDQCRELVVKHGERVDQLGQEGEADITRRVGYIDSVWEDQSGMGLQRLVISEGSQLFS